MEPHSLLAVEITLNCFTFVFALMRFWILRHRQHTTAEKISDGFFILAVAISIANVIGVCYKLSEEIELRRTILDPQVVEYTMFSPRFLKVSIDGSWGLSRR